MDQLYLSSCFNAIYNKLLKTAIAVCPDGHDCKAELTKTYAAWQILNTNTEQMRTKHKNEEQLLDIELSFPHERLNLAPHLHHAEEHGGEGGAGGGGADWGGGCMG